MVAVLKENAKELGVENFNIIEEMVKDLPQDGSLDSQFDVVGYFFSALDVPRCVASNFTNEAILKRLLCHCGWCS